MYLNGSAINNSFPNVKIELTGRSNLQDNAFRLNIDGAVEDLALWQGVESLSGFDKLRGSARINIGVFGAEELRIYGEFKVRNFAVDYKDNIHLNNCDINGDIFGATINYQGKVDVNGMNLPFNGFFRLNFSETNETTPQPVYSFVINQPKLEFANLKNPKPDDDSESLNFKGRGDLQLALEGVRDNWQSELRFKSDSLSYKNIDLKDTYISAVATKSKVQISDFRTDIEGGKFNAYGGLSLRKASDKTKPERIAWTYDRLVWKNEKSKWLSHDSAFVSASGHIKLENGKIVGSGDAFLTEEPVNSVSLMDSKKILISHLLFDNNDFNLSIYPISNKGKIEISLGFHNQTASSQAKGKNPQYIAKSLLSDSVYPEILDTYDIEFKIDRLPFTAGNFGEVNSEMAVFLKSDINNNKVKFTTNALSRNKDKIDFLSNLEILVGDSIRLAGVANIGFAQNDVNLERVFLERIASDNTLKTVLTASGSILHLEDNAGFFENRAPDSLQIALMNLPVFDLMSLVYPEEMKGRNGALYAYVSAHRDTCFFSTALNMTGQDSLEYILETEGSLINKKLNIQRSVLSSEESEPTFYLSGSMDFVERKIEDFTVRLSDFPLENAFSFIEPQNKSDYRGLIDARVELDGAFPKPEIKVDAHFRSGILHDLTGFWANLQIITDDSLYNLKRFDIGRNIQGYLNASGYYNRNTDEFDFDIDSEGADFLNLFEVFAGVKSPIRGQTDLAAFVKGNKYSQLGEARIIIDPGYLGPLSFDRLYGSFKIPQFKWRDLDLIIDSLSVDWGDLYAQAKGVVPLSGDDSIKVEGRAEGKFTGLLHRLEDDITNTQGGGRLNFDLAGTIANPKIEHAELHLTNNSFELPEVVSGIENLSAHVELNSSGKIQIHEMKGKVDERSFRFGNYFPNKEDNIEPVVIGGYNLGVLEFETEDDGIWMTIPSLMRDRWGGYFAFKGGNGTGPFEFRGPASNPLGYGTVFAHNTVFTYPFLNEGGRNPSPFAQWVLDLLERMRWDARLRPEWDNQYIREVSGFSNIPVFESLRETFPSEFFDFDVKLYVDLLIDENSEGLYFTGSLSDAFDISGELTSTQGSIEYLDFDFDVQKLGIIFTAGNLNPALYGYAQTAIVDTNNIMRTVRLTIQNKNQTTFDEFERTNQAAVQERNVSSGAWDEISIRLEDDQGHSQEQILAMMGYAPELISEKFGDLGSRLVENVLPWRRFTRMLNIRVERWLGLDYFEIDPQVARNIIQSQLSESDTANVSLGNYNYLTALDQSKLTVGKYLTRNIFVSYSGLLQRSSDTYNVTRLGMIHNWSLSVRLWQLVKNLNFKYNYEYDSLTELDDHSFSISYNFYID